MEKPAAFPQTLEIETTDFHIPSAPATIANIDIQKPKGAFPSLPTVLLQAHPSIGKDSPYTLSTVHPKGKSIVSGRDWYSSH